MDPPGWTYYKTAISLLDAYMDIPRLSTIQALLLLAKYHEHIHRPGFFWRTRFFVQLAVDMSNDLGLCSKTANETRHCSHDTEFKRRTFWAVYTYQVLMSTEQGSALPLTSKECTVDYPHVLSDETGSDASIASDFHWLSKVIHLQAAVIEFMRSKYSLDSKSENHQFDEMENTLSELGARIPNMGEGGMHASFVHIIYHLTVILLYRPYALQDKQETAYVSRCLASSSAITQIAEQVLNADGADPFVTVVRGNQQIMYCLTAAITIQRALKSTDTATNDMYNKTSSILKALASKSPVTELETSAVDSFFHTAKADQYAKSPSNTSSARSSPLMPSLNSPHISCF
ncbi:hypothetical protein G6F42_024632 [Rhizopus arrhizus]|nr:hypothetical protein G6F42_024632 [Rhizopus arrhizus]